MSRETSSNQFMNFHICLAQTFSDDSRNLGESRHLVFVFLKRRKLENTNCVPFFLFEHILVLIGLNKNFGENLNFHICLAQTFSDE